MSWQLIKPDALDMNNLPDPKRSKRARFLVDENLGSGTAEILQNWGYNARFAKDLGLAGYEDQDLFQTARKQRRILLTHDRRFLDERAFPSSKHPGVIVSGL